MYKFLGRSETSPSCQQGLHIFQMSIMANGTQEAIFLSMGGWNTYNMVQAAQEDAQKSQNLLYHISLSVRDKNSTGKTNLNTQKSSWSSKGSPKFRGAELKIFRFFAIFQSDKGSSHSEPFNPPWGGFQVDCAVSAKVWLEILHHKRL